MNRIYQGRTSRLDLLSDAKKDPEVLQSFASKELTNQANPLWQHHQVFQDAINYYLVALAGLAQGTENSTDDLAETERLAADLLKRVNQSWTEFRGSKEDRHLRKSLSQWLNLDGTASLKDAFDTIFLDTDTEPEVHRLALQLVLDRCGGEAAIQQGGREYLPKLCVATIENGKAYSGSYDFDVTAIEAAKGKARLAEILHNRPSLTELSSLAAEMDITWAGIKCKPAEQLSGDDLRHRLTSAINHQAERLSSPRSAAEREFVEIYPNWEQSLDSLRSAVPEIEETLFLPVNKGGNISWDLVHCAYLFKVFPSHFTGAALALSVKKPKKSKAKKTDENQAIDFAALGDDPIKLARGERGFVFPAFTSLPSWKPKSPGQPIWKEFDIAAFKEALKSLNQFSQKTKERSEQAKTLKGLIAIQLGGEKPKGWKPPTNDSGESEPTPTALDLKLLGLSQTLETRLTNELPDTVVSQDETSVSFGGVHYPNRSGQWRISGASLRGYRDIAEKWNQRAESEGEFLTSAELEDIVKDYQREEKNKKQVGSLPLLLALCEKEYWLLWRKDHDPDQEDRPSYNRFLYKVVGLHNDVREWQRSMEPINLTPAEPRHSRRLYMFSDITGREKVVFKDSGIFETTLAHTRNGSTTKQRVRIHYSAPRLRRDGLLSNEESRWLQPMTKALGLNLPEATTKFESAVSLMPDFDREGNTRYLLNFPKTLDESWLKAQIGREALWSGQFNGIKDKNLHLHWPQNDPKTKQAKETPWWKNPTLIANGFTTLSIDLGQRTAGAWTLLKITCSRPDTKRPVRSLGHDGEREWFAEVLRTGMLRLPGEDQKVSRKALDAHGKPIKGSRIFARELAGKAGRNATSSEYDEALELAKHLKADEPADWIGRDRKEKSFPQQNDSLLALANRRLSRLSTFHRWSCTAVALSDNKKDEATKTRIVAALLVELEHWQDELVHAWHGELLTTHPYLTSLFPRLENEEKRSAKGVRISTGKRNKVSGNWTEDQWQLWRENFQPNHFVKFSQNAGETFASYREQLKTHLLVIANRTAALRGKEWDWRTRPKKKGDDPDYGELVWKDSPTDLAPPKVRGQRGLSMERLEQLDTLRTLFLRLNRSFDKTAGKPSPVGFGLRHDAGEPAERLLKKIDRMKEQRVNNTAHLILAQALGVKLAEHEETAEDRSRRERNDIHGEYEKIPNREPVDFIVIENLDRYLTNQGRAPSENRRLMKWSHRAVRDKLKMLAEEPFGIPVVEAPAAYSSRFCAKTSQPGSRCEERQRLCKEKDLYLYNLFQKRAETKPSAPREDQREHYKELISQFEQLATLNKKQDALKKKPHTLLLPKPGGPLFIPAVHGQPTQADANAAINVGLRAMAAPKSLHIIHKLRTERRSGELWPVLKNAREKAAYDKGASVNPEENFCGKIGAATHPNFFHLAEEALDSDFYDKATLAIAGQTHHLISGVSMSTTTDDLVLKRIVDINRERLAKWEG